MAKFFLALTLGALVLGGFKLVSDHRSRPIREICDKLSAGAPFSAWEFSYLINKNGLYAGSIRELSAAVVVGSDGKTATDIQFIRSMFGTPEFKKSLLEIDQKKLSGVATAMSSSGLSTYTCIVRFAEGRVTTSELHD